MKAERRHELQTNSLILWLRWRAPELWAKYGTKILLGIVMVALAIVLARYFINKPKEEYRRATAALDQARQEIDLFKQRIREERDFTATTKALVDQALGTSSDPRIQARGFLLMGDYFWELHNDRQLSPAATQPGAASAPVEGSPAELLGKAEAHYRKALAVQADGPFVGPAMIALAMIAETRAYEADRQAGFKGQPSPLWATAREQYQAVINHPKVPQVQKDEAKWHLERLEERQKPIYLVRPEDVPATRPATTASAPAAAGPPATAPAAATPAASVPATVPATQGGR